MSSFPDVHRREKRLRWMEGDQRFARLGKYNRSKMKKDIFNLTRKGCGQKGGVNGELTAKKTAN